MARLAKEGMSALDLTKHPRVEPLIRPRGESQRARLLVAAFDVAGERGIQRTSVADIVKAAGVSRGTFYELFSSKEDCFVQAYRFASDLLLEVVSNAGRDAAGDWREGLRAGVRSYLCGLAFSPQFARAGLVEIQNAGEQGHAERDATLTRFADALGRLFERAANGDPGLRVPSSEALFVLAAGFEQLSCAYVRQGRVDELPDLEDVSVAAAEALFQGTAAQDRGVPSTLSPDGRTKAGTRASSTKPKHPRSAQRRGRGERGARRRS
jgi:AcrR family transcriptional regulator